MPVERAQRRALNGTEIELWRDGEGPPLLFLHGAGGAGGWRPFHAELARHFDVIAPAHPGFDGSTTPEWLDRIDDLAYFYLDLLRELDLRGVHLVGHSLGGWVAAELAIRDTSRLASLVLVAAAGIYLPGVERLDTFLLSPEARLTAMVHDPASIAPALAALADPASEDTVLKNQMTAARLLWQPRAYSPHLAKWLHRIDVPTLALWGRSDPVVPPAYADAFGRMIPRARVRVLEACGHLVPLEQTRRFVDEILAFTAEAQPEHAA